MLLALAFVVPQTATAQTVLPAGFGDVNVDGNVDARDVTLLVNIVLGKSPFSLMTADLNADGNVDAMDVTTLVSFILENGTTTPTTGNVSVNVLVLGNSYSLDAFGYMPYLLRELAPKMHINVGILNQGSGSLNWLWNAIRENKPHNTYYWSNGVSPWWTSALDTITVRDVLSRQRWDLVVLQQNSAESFDYITYQPALDSITTWLKDTMTNNVKFAWLLTPAYPEGQASLGTMTSNEMYDSIARCAQRVAAESDVSLVFPCGTAIQNARTTALDTLGIVGHLSHDGRHLTDGIPCLIENLTAAMVIANWKNVSVNIDNYAPDITLQWVNQKMVPQATKMVIETTPERVAIAKECVKAAFANPFAITDCSSFNPPADNSEQ